MIKPTIGRKVWFTPAASSDTRFDKSQPLDATVVYVWNDRCVNLQVRDQNGQSFGQSSVPLLQDDDNPIQLYPAGYYAEWMPYQKSAAK